MKDILLENYPSCRLVCLKDKEGGNLALGIVDEVDKEKREIFLYTPLEKFEEVINIIPGKIKITPEGKQIY